MQFTTKALIVAALLIVADQIWFQGRLSSQLLDQANGFGTKFQWEMAAWLHKVS
ncbi:MAG TPA: hypothetical protein VMJ52_15145 [Xanthobacteraceae bacterium]|nr:hypothetical protein [Xanthobacteraceae bacterium]